MGWGPGRVVMVLVLAVVDKIVVVVRLFSEFAMHLDAVQKHDFDSHTMYIGYI